MKNCHSSIPVITTWVKDSGNMNCDQTCQFCRMEGKLKTKRTIQTAKAWLRKKKVKVLDSPVWSDPLIT